MQKHYADDFSVAVCLLSLFLQRLGHLYARCVLRFDDNDAKFAMQLVSFIAEFGISQ